MSHTRGQFFGVALCVLAASIVTADILVSINVNKPIHDVSEQFVSFSIPPELLFESLDGPNKKQISDMAALLGPSYLKLTGDFFFPTDLKSNLKNPTQSIWSGFNRWTRAMNWTMVIPVQYTPLTWDPIDALRVLNISNTVGIDSCIWQLGLDFGASRAADYVADLNTLDTMVDTFRPYVNNWKVIGADITAGSSADETKRYIDMSREVNAAYGWTQPAGYHVEENVNGYIYDKDLSLKAMMEKKVPVWLSVPPKSPLNQVSNSYTSVEISEALRWAQTLGDAASSGFDAVFKPLTTEDVSTPNYSFFVTALFKKVMGNRVFSAKPVKRFNYATKLYTHCANGISGGIVFMGVNTEEYAVKISAKLSAKYTGSEVWQFVLTSKKGTTYLNNEVLTLNSTLEPFVRIKHPNKPLAISMPPMSVSFWVLPLANHEDCQFTELLSSYNPEAQWENRQRRQTSSDRLLKKLILETSLTDQMKNRRRRDTSSNNLHKGSTSRKANIINRNRRFILQDTPASATAPATVGVQLSLQERNLKKREDAHNWFKTLVKPVIIPKVDWTLKRSRRGADFLSSLFPSQNPVPAKGGLRRQSALSTKQRFANEANIFTKATDNADVDIPQGDVHLQYIMGADGEEIRVKESRENSEEVKSAELSNKELPSEFYEAISYDKYQPKFTGNRGPQNPKKDEISNIEGYTKYMTQNQLESKFAEFDKGQGKAYTPRRSSDGQHKAKSIFATEFNSESRRQTDTSKKYLHESDEVESLTSYMGSPASPWSVEKRARRSLDYSKLQKSIEDNLISKDETIQSLSYIVPEMSETIAESSITDFEGKPGVAESVKSHVSKLINAVKGHLSGFFNSLLN